MKDTILTDDQKKEVEELMDDEGVEKPKEIVYSKTIDSEEITDEDNIGSSKSKLDFEPITRLLQDSSHLDGYNIFDEDLGLIGDGYTSMKKCLYYYQNSLRQNTVHYEINKKTKVDNRSHILVITGPGTGKTTIKNQNKRVLSDFEELDGVIEVAGLSHPEQLVGKIVYEGKGENKKPVEKMGILGYNCVMNDESQDLLNEKNDIYAKAQRLKRLAMDTFGDNKISKKLVGDSPKDVLEYDSPSRMCDFAHPVKLESPFLILEVLEDIWPLILIMILSLN